MFFGKDVLKICSKFTVEHPCRSVISIKLQSNFIETTLRLGFSWSIHGCSGGVLRKKYSKNMQQMYRRTPTPKCNFNKVAKELYWNYTSAWVFSRKFLAYFRNIALSKNTSGRLLLYLCNFMSWIDFDWSKTYFCKTEKLNFLILLILSLYTVK